MAPRIPPCTRRSWARASAWTRPLKAATKASGLVVLRIDWLAIAWMVASVFLTRWLSSLKSRARISSLRLRSVTSRATFEAPTMLPLLSRIGEMVSEMWTWRPSFATRTVSKWSIRSPARSRARISSSSGCSSGGMIRLIDRPSISSWV